MGLFDWLWRRSDAPRTLPAETDGRAVIEYLDPSPMVASWAAVQPPGTLEDLWSRCPRADWVLDIAVAAGLDDAAIRAALKRCLPDLELADGADLARAVGAHVDARTDANPEVLEAREADREAAGRDSRLGLLSEEHERWRITDAIELELHGSIAAVLREVIGYQAIRAALWPSAAGPYR